LSERACELTKDADPECLDTLAAAYAEVGRFDDAARSARRAIELATANRAAAGVDAFRRRLAAYESRTPWHAQ